MDLIEKRLCLPRKNLALLQFLLEGYDHMFTVTTLDAQAAVVRIFWSPSGCRNGMNVITALMDELDGRLVSF